LGHITQTDENPECVAVALSPMNINPIRHCEWAGARQDFANSENSDAMGAGTARNVSAPYRYQLVAGRLKKRMLRWNDLSRYFRAGKGLLISR